MSDERFDDRAEQAHDHPAPRLSVSDVLAVLAVASFLAAVTLVTFFVSSALSA